MAERILRHRWHTINSETLTDMLENAKSMVKSLEELKHSLVEER